MRGLRRGIVMAPVVAGLVALTGTPRGARCRPNPWTDLEPSGPAPRATDAIETATLMENPSWSVGGRRYAIDEHALNPVRARVTAGARVRFVNNARS